jgi:GNAT superfamily N-acetyltransferase
MPPEIPIQLIGRLGVDRRLKGQGVGRHLVVHAQKQVLEVSKLTAVRALMVRSKPDAIEFYKSIGFEQSASDPLLFFFLVKDIAKTLEAAPPW